MLGEKQPNLEPRYFFPSCLDFSFHIKEASHFARSVN